MKSKTTCGKMLCSKCPFGPTVGPICLIMDRWCDTCTILFNVEVHLIDIQVLKWSKYV